MREVVALGMIPSSGTGGTGGNPELPPPQSYTILLSIGLVVVLSQGFILALRVAGHQTVYNIAPR